MKWLRRWLVPHEDDTDVDQARFRQREKVQAWDRVHQSIADTERAIRGERRQRNVGHFPERRHG